MYFEWIKQQLELAEAASNVGEAGLNPEAVVAMARRFDRPSQSVLNAFSEPEPAPDLYDLPRGFQPTTPAAEPVTEMDAEQSGNPSSVVYETDFSPPP